MKNDLLEEMIKVLEDAGMKFDRDNPEDLNIMAKVFVLSQKSKEELNETKELYMKTIAEPEQRERCSLMIKDKGQDIVKYELDKLNLEKEILERKIEITKKFLN